MAGRTLNLLDFTDFNFSGLDTGGTTSVWLAQYVAMGPYDAARLAVSVRSADIAELGSEVELVFVAASTLSGDPATFYRDGRFPSAGVKLTGPLTSSGGLLLTKELATAGDAPLPAMLSLRMDVSQAKAATALAFTIAVDLQLLGW